MTIQGSPLNDSSSERDASQLEVSKQDTPKQVSHEPYRPKPYVPTEPEAALLLIELARAWGEEKGTTPTRFRLSEAGLKRVCVRPRLHDDFVSELQDWLLRYGWILFSAGTSFAMIKRDAVDNWTRLGTKRITEKLKEVNEGLCDFTELAKSLTLSSDADSDD